MPSRGTPRQMAETAKAIAQLLKLDFEDLESKYGTHKSTEMPPWVTPDVTHGGLPMPGSPAAKLCDDEPLPSFEDMMHMLWTGSYQIEHAEHGALLAVLALIQGGYVEEAREILEAIEPWTDIIRFFPKATPSPPPPPSEEFAPSSPEKAVNQIQSLLNDLVSIPPASEDTVALLGERSFHRPRGPRDLRTMLLVLFTEKLTVVDFMLQADECLKLYRELTSVPNGCTKCIACTGPTPKDAIVTPKDAIGDTRLCHEHKGMTIQPCTACGSPPNKTVYHHEYTFATHRQVFIELRSPTQCFDELVALGTGLSHWINVYVQPYRNKTLSPKEVEQNFVRLLKTMGWYSSDTAAWPPKLTFYMKEKHVTVRDLCSKHAIQEGVVMIYNARKLTNQKNHGTIVRLIPIVEEIVQKILAEQHEDGEFDLESFVGAKRGSFVRTTVTNAVNKYGIPGTPQYKERFGLIELAMKRTAERIVYLKDVIRRLKASGPSPVGVPAAVMATILGDLEKSPFYKGDVETILKRAILKPIQERATSPELLAELCMPLMTMVAVGVPRHGEPQFLRTILQRMMQAFMTRRSIMLLNTEGQVRASDVPFIAVLQRVLKVDEHSKESRLDGLKWLMTTYLDTFPHCMMPNEILRLVRECNHDIPVLEDIASDIFQGHLVPKFGVVCKLAANLLGPDSVYGQYYGDNLSQLWKRRAITSADLVKWAGWGLEDVYPDTTKNGMTLERVRVATCHNMVMASSVVSGDFLFTLGLGFDWRGAALKTWKFIVRLGITERFPWLLRSDIRKLVQAWNLLLFYLSRYVIALQKQQIATHGFKDAADDFGLYRFSTDMKSVLDNTPLVLETDKSLLIDFFVTPIETIAMKGAWDGSPVYGWFTAHLPLDSCSVIAALRIVTPLPGQKKAEEEVPPVVAE